MFPYTIVAVAVLKNFPAFSQTYVLQAVSSCLLNVFAGLWTEASSVSPCPDKASTLPQYKAFMALRRNCRYTPNIRSWDRISNGFLSEGNPWINYGFKTLG